MPTLREIMEAKKKMELDALTLANKKRLEEEKTKTIIKVEAPLEKTSKSKLNDSGNTISNIKRNTSRKESLETDFLRQMYEVYTGRTARLIKGPELLKWFGEVFLPNQGVYLEKVGIKIQKVKQMYEDKYPPK